jgi:protein-tyrosine kinase
MGAPEMKALASPPAIDATPPLAVHDRAIGELIREARPLSDEQIDMILAYQRQHGLRFGEAAIALDLASNEDVLRALAQQFHYPFAPEATMQVGAELVAAREPFSDEAEAFRELRSQLLMSVQAEGERRALAVVSPDTGDGKTYLAANLAVVFGQLGGRTLVVDADLRTPRLHRVFDVSNGAGLSTVLSGRSEASVIQRAPHLPNLFVLPAGAVPPNPLELVQRPAFGLLMHELLAKFDHVVVDTPAGVHGADARVIAAKCGAVLLLARGKHSQVKRLQSLIHALDKGPAVMAGVVMNDY